MSVSIHCCDEVPLHPLVVIAGLGWTMFQFTVVTRRPCTNHIGY